MQLESNDQLNGTELNTTERIPNVTQNRFINSEKSRATWMASSATTIERKNQRKPNLRENITKTWKTTKI